MAGKLAAGRLQRSAISVEPVARAWRHHLQLEAAVAAGLARGERTWRWPEGTPPTPTGLVGQLPQQSPSAGSPELRAKCDFIIPLMLNVIDKHRLVFTDELCGELGHEGALHVAVPGVQAG